MSRGILICKSCKKTGTIEWHPKDEPNLVKIDGNFWNLDNEFIKDHYDCELYCHSDCFGHYNGYEFGKGLTLNDDGGYNKLFSEDYFRPVGTILKVNWRCHHCDYYQEENISEMEHTDDDELIFVNRECPRCEITQNLIIHINDVKLNLDDMRSSL